MRETIEHTIRAREWWSHKLAAIVGIGYGTVLFADGDLLAAAPALALGLVALVPGAAFVSVLNDYTDLELDRAAGKPNRLAGLPRSVGRRAIAAAIAAGAALAVPVALVSGWAVLFYVPAWLAFTAYSVPPLRLKERGVLGAVADALGAHLFPQLTVVALAFAGAGIAIDWGWIGLIAAWSFAYGLRGAIWHQSTDAGGDAASGVGTLVVSHPRLALRGARWVVFPLEVTALAAILVLVGSVIPFVALALYLALELARARLWQVKIVIAGAADRYRIVMQEYYAVVLPLAFLLAAAIANPADLLIGVVHLAAFGPAVGRLCLDSARATAGLSSPALGVARRRTPIRIKHAFRQFERRLRH